MARPYSESVSGLHMNVSERLIPLNKKGIEEQKTDHKRSRAQPSKRPFGFEALLHRNKSRTNGVTGSLSVHAK